MWNPDNGPVSREQLQDADGNVIDHIVTGTPCTYVVYLTGDRAPEDYDTFRVEDENGDLLHTSEATHGDGAVTAGLTAPEDWRGRKVRLGFVDSSTSEGVGGSFAYPVVTPAGS